MLNFDICAPTQIVFGKGGEERIGELLKPHATKVLLHYGGGSIKRNGLYDTVAASLGAHGVQFAELGGVKPNPRVSLVREGIELCRRENIDLILAVGGGSVIDSAKAIAMGVYCDFDVWDIFAKGKRADKALPIATILTLPAAGSESGEATVISNEEEQLKYSHGNPILVPMLSVINPELFFTLPKDQIANGAVDIMSHAMERYFTNTNNTDLSDALSEAILRTVIKNAPLALANPQDYDAWAEIGYSSTGAVGGLAGAGRQADWACHCMEHELSAVYDVPHGAGLAVLTPGWMEYVYKENIGIFVQFAVNVMGVSGSYRDPDVIAREGIARLRAFFRSLGLPSTLSELGIPECRLEEMAKKATFATDGEGYAIGGLKKLYWRNVLEIFRSVS